MLHKNSKNKNKKFLPTYPTSKFHAIGNQQFILLSYIKHYSIDTYCFSACHNHHNGQTDHSIWISGTAGMELLFRAAQLLCQAGLSSRDGYTM